MVKRLFIVLGVLLVFASGWVSGVAIYKKGLQREKEKRSGQYQYINPLLECEGSEELISRDIIAFQDKIEELISDKTENGKITNASVYFRDLNNGPWFGIDEDRRFTPGSLLKIPVMLGYMKEAETNPAIMKVQLRFDSKLPPYTQYVKPATVMELGKSYTIEELIYRMIVNSDNDATYLLILHDKGRIYNKVFADLGLTVPPFIGPYEISVHQYGRFFRILFNASYLNKESSNTALQLLSYVDFPMGMRAGVPSEIPVAQKFGEATTDGLKQFHDCGIVYYPGYPYLLCVMTQGDSYEELGAFIRDVSRISYEEVDRQLTPEGE